MPSPLNSFVVPPAAIPPRLPPPRLPPPPPRPLPPPLLPPPMLVGEQPFTILLDEGWLGSNPYDVHVYVKEPNEMFTIFTLLGGEVIGSEVFSW